ncbi:MAG: Uma2 family endonuclease [Gemmatimonadetes bacterium]|nr:MAG: Uma2 family endonuclease [Gemmatimonadota bacterium]
MGMPLSVRRFSVDEYHRMAQAGLFDEDDRIELLDGQIVEMSPIGPGHAGCVDVLTRLLSRLVGDRALLRVQNPIRLGRDSEPQPDVALLVPRADAYRTAHPQPEHVLLVIEVADTSLEHDRDVKIPLYAAAGIPEVWLVNLPGDVVALYRDPSPQGYATVRTAGRGDTLTPHRLPGVTLRVDDILG